MGKKIQLSVPAPCHENWESMTPVEKGKFCGSCQKQVIDFSRMSDREVAMFFKKPSTGSVCGRFMNDQLERDMEIPRKRIPWVKYFFQFAIPAFLVSCKPSTVGKLKEITTVNKQTAETNSNSPSFNNFSNQPISEAIIVGMIFTETEPTIKGDVECGPLRDTTKSSGEPAIEIMGDIKAEIIDDKPGAGELQSTKIFNDTLLLPEVVVADNPKTTIRGQVIPTCASTIKADSPKYNIQTLQGRVGAVYISRTDITVKPQDSLFKRFFKRPAEMFFMVFPNPAQSGSSINIEWKQSETGYYLLQLLNPSGQLILTKEIWIDEEARVSNVQLPSVAAGTYFLRITNKKTGKGYTEKMIIQ